MSSLPYEIRVLKWRITLGKCTGLFNSHFLMEDMKHLKTLGLGGKKKVLMTGTCFSKMQIKEDSLNYSVNRCYGVLLELHKKNIVFFMRFYAAYRFPIPKSEI